MKLASCESREGRRRQFVAAVVGDEIFVDLAEAQAVLRGGLTDAAVEPRIPDTMIAFLAAGAPAMAAARSVVEAVAPRVTAGELSAPDGQRVAWRREEVRLLAPVPRPGKIVHTSVNFRGHLKELSDWKSPGWESHGWDRFHYEHPTGFLQAPSCVTGTDSEVMRPRFTRELDYEIELAIIIGRRCKHVPQQSALDVVAGYTVFNDISARDIQGREHANNVILLGKSFDTSCPLGPWMVTADDIPDPQVLQMTLRVNGEIRQNDSTAKMHYKVRELVSWWSNFTLEPGDIITSGSIPGVAAAMEIPRYLQPGDRIEATIDRIGTLVNQVVEEHD